MDPKRLDVFRNEDYDNYLIKINHTTHIYLILTKNESSYEMIGYKVGAGIIKNVTDKKGILPPLKVTTCNYKDEGVNYKPVSDEVKTELINSEVRYVKDYTMKVIDFAQEVAHADIE